MGRGERGRLAGSRERAEPARTRRPLRATARAGQPVRARGRAAAGEQGPGCASGAGGGGYGPKPEAGRAPPDGERPEESCSRPGKAFGRRAACAEGAVWRACPLGVLGAREDPAWGPREAREGPVWEPRGAREDTA